MSVVKFSTLCVLPFVTNPSGAVAKWALNSNLVNLLVANPYAAYFLVAKTAAEERLEATARTVADFGLGPIT